MPLNEKRKQTIMRYIEQGRQLNYICQRLRIDEKLARKYIRAGASDFYNPETRGFNGGVLTCEFLKLYNIKLSEIHDLSYQRSYKRPCEEIPIDKTNPIAEAVSALEKGCDYRAVLKAADSFELESVIDKPQHIKDAARHDNWRIRLFCGAILGRMFPSNPLNYPYFGSGLSKMTYNKLDLRSMGAFTGSSDLIAKECEFNGDGVFKYASDILIEGCSFNGSEALVKSTKSTIKKSRVDSSSFLSASKQPYVSDSALSGNFIGAHAIRPIFHNSCIEGDNALYMSDGALVVNCTVKGENPFNSARLVFARMPEAESICPESGFFVIQNFGRVELPTNDTKKSKQSNVTVFAVNYNENEKRHERIFRIKPEDMEGEWNNSNIIERIKALQRKYNPLERDNPYQKPLAIIENLKPEELQNDK